jgi:DNA repair photolyase
VTGGRAHPRGRGVASNPSGRFETQRYEADPDGVEEEREGPRTVFLPDATRSIIARNDSPDLPFDASVNPYRGCEHGCAYCFARPFHEYLGYSAGLDFESKILYKADAPALLRGELAARSWTPQVISFSGVTDPYQPVERRMELTRGCLRMCADFRNPVIVVTKNALVERDADILAELAAQGAAAVLLSVPSLDPTLTRALEPRASVPQRRLAAMRTLADRGIPVGIFIAPVIPGLTDHELPALIEAGVAAGATWAGYVPLRLPGGVAELFGQWLHANVPDRAEKVLQRVRAMKGGQLNDARFGHRMRATGPHASQLSQLFHAVCRRSGMPTEPLPLSAVAFRVPPGPQLDLF